MKRKIKREKEIETYNKVSRRGEGGGIVLRRVAWCAVESFEREGVCRHGTVEGVREEESDRARGPEERERERA